MVEEGRNVKGCVGSLLGRFVTSNEGACVGRGPGTGQGCDGAVVEVFGEVLGTCPAVGESVPPRSRFSDAVWLLSSASSSRGAEDPSLGIQ